MNLYATVAQVKEQANISATTWDAWFLRMLDVACRSIEDWCSRHFYTITGSKYYDAPGSGGSLSVHDLLTVTSFAVDTDSDWDYTDEAWEATDYTLLPLNAWPKIKIIETSLGDYSFGSGQKEILITGTWGYGDGQSASPWTATGQTATVADTTSTSVTMSGTGAVAVYQTILVGTEQMYVTAVTTAAADVLTVIRGVNGTTAAIQAAASVSTANYPSAVIQTAIELVIEAYNEKAAQGLESEWFGSYGYRRMKKTIDYQMTRFIGPYRRY